MQNLALGMFFLMLMGCERSVFISAIRDIPTVIFLSTHETRTLALLMLDHIAEANQEKAAVLGVFLVFVIFALLLAGRLLGVRRPSLQ